LRTNQAGFIFISYQIDKVISNNHQNLRHPGTIIAFALWCGKLINISAGLFLNYKFGFRCEGPVAPANAKGGDNLVDQFGDSQSNVCRPPG
jgi:hypothetical protein